MASGFDWQGTYDALFQLYGECVCPLRHDTPFQLLVAVVLSAQCRDDRVNQVTQSLFRIAGTPEAMAALTPEQLAGMIRSCGLYRSKAENLVAASRRIVEVHGGAVPRTMEELVALPGVGRKSANVILGNAFGIPGFPVDTHVKRLLNRLGAVSSGSPEKIESAANRAVPPERWTNFSHLLITHGRQVCHARGPECSGCALAGKCAFFKRSKKK